MAWCPHCNCDRPIQRQTYEGVCPICSTGQIIGNSRFEHGQLCRGPVIGALDVCKFCNSPIFAKAKSLKEYSELANNEAVMRQQNAQIIAQTTPFSRFDSPVQVVLLVVYLIGGVLFGYKLFGVPGIILGLIVGGLMGVFGPDRVK